MRLARACSRALARGTSVAAPEPEFAAPAADDEPLDPASRPGGLDEQVQPVAVGVRPGGAVRTRAAERALSGWRPRRLVLWGVAAGLATTSIPPSYAGWSRILPYFLTRPVRDEES